MSLAGIPGLGCACDGRGRGMQGLGDATSNAWAEVDRLRNYAQELRNDPYNTSANADPDLVRMSLETAQQYEDRASAIVKGLSDAAYAANQAEAAPTVSSLSTATFDVPPRTNPWTADHQVGVVWVDKSGRAFDGRQLEAPPTGIFQDIFRGSPGQTSPSVFQSLFGVPGQPQGGAGYAAPPAWGGRAPVVNLPPERPSVFQVPGTNPWTADHQVGVVWVDKSGRAFDGRQLEAPPTGIFQDIFGGSPGQTSPSVFQSLFGVPGQPQGGAVGQAWSVIAPIVGKAPVPARAPAAASGPGVGTVLLVGGLGAGAIGLAVALGGRKAPAAPVKANRRWGR